MGYLWIVQLSTEQTHITAFTTHTHPPTHTHTDHIVGAKKACLTHQRQGCKNNFFVSLQFNPLVPGMQNVKIRQFIICRLLMVCFVKWPVCLDAHKMSVRDQWVNWKWNFNGYSCKGTWVRAKRQKIHWKKHRKHCRWCKTGSEEINNLFRGNNFYQIILIGSGLLNSNATEIGYSLNRFKNQLLEPNLNPFHPRIFNPKINYFNLLINAFLTSKALFR